MISVSINRQVSENITEKRFKEEFGTDPNLYMLPIGCVFFLTLVGIMITEMIIDNRKKKKMIVNNPK